MVVVALAVARHVETAVLEPADEPAVVVPVVAGEKALAAVRVEDYVINIRQVRRIGSCHSLVVGGLPYLVHLDIRSSMRPAHEDVNENEDQQRARHYIEEEGRVPQPVLVLDDEVCANNHDRAKREEHEMRLECTQGDTRYDVTEEEDEQQARQVCDGHDLQRLPAGSAHRSAQSGLVLDNKEYTQRQGCCENDREYDQARDLDGRFGDAAKVGKEISVGEE